MAHSRLMGNSIEAVPTPTKNKLLTKNLSDWLRTVTAYG